MSRRLLASIAVVLAVAACGDDREQSLTSPDLAPRGSTCSYNDVKQYARNLFGVGTPEYDLAQQMSGFAAGSPDATALAFDIFAAIAAERNDGVFSATDLSNAANLTVKTIGCATVSASPGASLTLAAFTAALKASGAYEVRGDADKDAATDLTLVQTADGLSAVNTPIVDGADQRFSDWLPARTLFFARPLSSTFSNEASSGRAYDWSLLQPGGSYSGIGGPARVAICIEVDDNASTEVFRVEHDAGAANTILPLHAPLLVCPNPLPAIAVATPIRNRLLEFFMPQPAYAAALGKTSSPTGSAGSFSPFEGVNPAVVIVHFTVEPRDGTKNQPIKGAGGADIAVKVTGAALTPWEGVTVKLVGVNNNGEKVELSNATDDTDANGIAVFPLVSTNKTGAYKLIAETQETNPGTVSFLQGSDTSRKFNIRP